MVSYSSIRDALLIGSLYLAVLVVIAVLIAIIQDQSPVPFTIELFTNPFWLFTVLITSFFVVSGFRKAKQKQAEKTS